FVYRCHPRVRLCHRHLPPIYFYLERWYCSVRTSERVYFPEYPHRCFSELLAIVRLATPVSVEIGQLEEGVLYHQVKLVPETGVVERIRKPSGHLIPDATHNRLCQGH